MRKYWAKIARRNGIDSKQFSQRVRGGWEYERAATTPIEKRRNRYDEYALYKGDVLVSIGTLEELAAERGVKVSTMEFRLRPTYLKRMEASGIGNFLRLVPLDDDEVM